MLVGAGTTLYRELGSLPEVAVIEKESREMGGEMASRRADLRKVKESFELREDAAWFNGESSSALATLRVGL
eukprot:1307246-Rhodomonas_salina.1